MNSNPYFIGGSWSSLGLSASQWYLLVGVIWGAGFTGGDQGIAGIYDPRDGTRVINGTEYRFRSNATQIIHRAYHFYNTNTSTQQWFARPRLELIEDALTIKQLLGRDPLDAVGQEYVYLANGGATPTAPSNTWGYRSPPATNAWKTTPPNLNSTNHTLWRAERDIIGTPTAGDSVSDNWSTPVIFSRYGTRGVDAPSSSGSYQGTWTTGFDYVVGDRVIQLVGQFDYEYECQTAHTSSSSNQPDTTDPPTDNTWWLVV